MAAASRICLILLFAFGGNIVQSHDGHSSSLSLDIDYALNSSLEDIIDTQQRRSLLRNNKIENERTQNISNIPSIPTPLNQAWFGLNTKLNDGIKEGAINVCIFLIGWFIFMCTIGCGMRCYLCCDTMRSSSSYTIQSLYNSFMDTEECYQSEREGITLDTIQDTVDRGNESDYA